jgi:predicted DCC family thiol-disulfide oxidoreductase YuxK
MGLTVYYDEACPVCVRCRDWMEGQVAFVPLRFVSCRSKEAVARGAGLAPFLGAELVVVDHAGNAWVGPAAFVMCLWALENWRPWSYRLTGAGLAPMAERFFQTISKNRHGLASFLDPIKPEDCRDGHCQVSVPSAPYR